MGQAKGEGLWEWRDGAGEEASLGWLGISRLWGAPSCPGRDSGFCEGQ